MNNKNKNKPDKKGNQSNDVQFFNDQLGENASEEFKSDAYTNAVNTDNRNTGKK